MSGLEPPDSEDLLARYQDTETLGDAERALADLETVSAELADWDVAIGDLYDDLAGYAADEGDTAAAGP